MKGKRSYLTDYALNERLIFKVQKGDTLFSFEIRGLESENQESVLYRISSRGQYGYLREFFPSDIKKQDREALLPKYNFTLSRDANGIPFLDAETLKERAEMSEEEIINEYSLANESFERRFSLLDEKMKKLSDNEEHDMDDNELAKRLPHFAIIHNIVGFKENENNYVVSFPKRQPGNATNTLQEYFSQKLKELEAKSSVVGRREELLVEMIEVLNKLVDFFRVFYERGNCVLNMDLSNFTIRKDDNFNFDLETISLKNLDLLESFPDGETPKIERGNPYWEYLLHWTGDLFLKIINSNDKHYDTFARYVTDSPIIANSMASSSTSVMAMMINILENTLGETNYESIKELSDNLDQLCTKIENVVMNISKGNLDGTDAQAKRRMVILNSFLNNPLSDWIDKMDWRSPINVLVLGVGNYGEEFLDVCLQVGQIGNHPLNITALDKDPDAVYKRYVGKRPAMDEFVQINVLDKDGNLDKKEYRGETKSIRGIQKELYDPLATLTFGYMPPVDSEEGLEEFVEFFKEMNKDGKFQYIFVALGGSDTLRATEALSEAYTTSIEANKFCLNYVVSERGALKAKNTFEVIVPETKENIDEALKQIALNLHLVWGNESTPDMGDIARKFEKPYYLNSSLSSTIAFLNNLQDMHIYDAKIVPGNKSQSLKNLNEAAKVFVQKRDQKERFRNFLERDLLIVVHNVWLMERVTDGWRAPYLEGYDKYNPSYKLLDFKEMARHLGKDYDNKFHPALVRSRAGSNLIDAHYGPNDIDAWRQDNNTTNPDSLDPLDRTSLGLFRAYDKLRDEFSSSGQIYQGELAVIKQKVDFLVNGLGLGNDPAVQKIADAYDKLYFCAFSILDGYWTYASKLEDYVESFRQSLRDGMPESERSELASLERSLDALKKDMLILRKGLDRHDYKEDDRRIIRNIPFILTNDNDITLASFFNPGGNTRSAHDLFKNVASASVLMPNDVIYFYLHDGTIEFKEFIKRFQNVMRYYDARKLKARIRLIVVLPDREPEKTTGLKEEIQKSLNEMYQEERKRSDRLLRPELRTNPSLSSCLEYIKRRLTLLRNEQTEFYLDMTNPITKRLEPLAKFITELDQEAIPRFSFDSAFKRFYDVRGCDHFKYIDTDRMFLRVEEMLALSDKVNTKFVQPEFREEYEDLWKIYVGTNLNHPERIRKNIMAWNELSSLLVNSMGNDDIVHDQEVQFYLGRRNSGNRSEEEESWIDPPYRFIFPTICYPTVSKLLNILKSNGIVSSDSRINVNLNGSSEILLKTKSETNGHPRDADQPSFQKLFERLFGKPIHLCDDEMIGSHVSENGQFLHIKYSNLCVSNLNVFTLNVDPEDPKFRELLEEHDGSILEFNDRYIFSNKIRMIEILRELEEQGLIVNLQVFHKLKNPNSGRNQNQTDNILKPIAVTTYVSFFYSTLRVKELLETAGKFLEIYTFFTVIKRNYFDDVLYSVKINDKTNFEEEMEIDLILTKGFRSYIIECKGTIKLKRDDYNKLSNKDLMLGVNSKKIIVALKYGTKRELEDSNQRVISFGHKMNIETVEGAQEVKSIGETLEVKDKKRIEESELFSDDSGF